MRNDRQPRHKTHLLAMRKNNDMEGDGCRRRSSGSQPSVSGATARIVPAAAKRSPLLLVFIFALCWCCSSPVDCSSTSATRLASSSSSSALVASTAASPEATSAAATPPPQANKKQQQKSPNAVVQLAGYVKTSVTRTVDGCGQLWKNHGKCNTIRKKISAYRDELKQQYEEMSDDGTTLSQEQKQALKTKVGGITFEEYSFLQKGKEDRGKVMNLAFLMWGAPRFLPYALLFNPEMLPSPFISSKADSPSGSVESVWAKQSRERSTAVVQTLIQMEQNSRVVPALSKINIFGKKKQEQRKTQLSNLVELASTYMTNRRLNATHILSKLELYRVGSDFDRAEQRLCGVPKPVVKGLSNVLGSTGFLGGIQPHFMTRGRVVGHVKKVTESDDFLVSNSVNVTAISKRLLQEACSDRMIMVPATISGVEEMRESLTEWLDLTVNQPALRIQEHQQQSGGDEQQVCYYNGNLARMALMAYHSCLAARDSRSTLQLPRLLFTGTESSSSSSRQSSRKSKGGEDSRTGSSWSRLPFKKSS